MIVLRKSSGKNISCSWICWSTKLKDLMGMMRYILRGDTQPSALHVTLLNLFKTLVLLPLNVLLECVPNVLLIQDLLLN